MKTFTFGLNALLAKIGDDILICGLFNHVDDKVTMIQRKLTLRTITHGHGLIRFFGLNIVQNNHYSVTIDGDDKIAAIDKNAVTRVKRHELESRLSAAEAKAFV